jgi:subtilase family serine protease
VNKSMSSDSRLMPIITKWEIAADKLSTAKDLKSQGKYDEAALKADEAAAKGNEVLTEAQALKEKVDSGPFSALGGIGSALTGSIIKIVIIIVVVILVVVGILLFRRRRRWDELG